MKKQMLSFVVIMVLAGSFCLAEPGQQTMIEDGEVWVERTLETVDGREVTLTRNTLHPVRNFAGRDGSVTWSVEDWYGSYGAIAEDVDVTGDGSRIYVAWNLNYERIAAFDSTGDGTPIWEYDVLDEAQYYLGGSVHVASSDDGQVVLGAFDQRELAGQDDHHSKVFRLNTSNGEVSWSDTMPFTSHEPLNTEKITHLEVSADGSRVAVAAKGYRYDPIYEPLHLYIYDNSGILLHTFEIEDSTGDIYYLNDMKLTQDGSRLVADFRQSINPSHMIKAWDLTNYTEIQTFGVNFSPPQCSIGLSGNGGVLAIGDLHGYLRVYNYTDTPGEYQFSWQYHIPPDYYYAWVKAVSVSRDGSIVAMGSYQPNQTEEVDHLYVFRTESGSEVLYQSPDFGGSVVSVAVSETGKTVVGASYGPKDNPAAGWDLIAYSTVSDTELFMMEGTYPGSLMSCDIDLSGTRATAGGKRVHAYEMGSGGWAYSIELEDEQIPTPTSTPTVTFTSTPTNTPTFTPECPLSGASGELSSEIFHAGDTFLLSIEVCNNNPSNPADNPVFVILDVFGIYFFAPGWTDELDFYDWEVPSCACTGEDVLDFTWPENAGTGSGLIFYIAMTNEIFSEIIGDIVILSFGWE